MIWKIHLPHFCIGDFPEPSLLLIKTQCASDILSQNAFEELKKRSLCTFHSFDRFEIGFSEVSKKSMTAKKTSSTHFYEYILELGRNSLFWSLSCIKKKGGDMMREQMF